MLKQGFPLIFLLHFAYLNLDILPYQPDIFCVPFFFSSEKEKKIAYLSVTQVIDLRHVEGAFDSPFQRRGKRPHLCLGCHC